jgi:hypothetical protein
VLILALAKGFEHPEIEFCIIFGMAADYIAFEKLETVFCLR